MLSLDLTVQTYVDGRSGARRLRPAVTAVPMFLVPAAANAIVWTNGSHTAQADKPAPLGLSGGST